MQHGILPRLDAVCSDCCGKYRCCGWSHVWLKPSCPWPWSGAHKCADGCHLTPLSPSPGSRPFPTTPYLSTSAMRRAKNGVKGGRATPSLLGTATREQISDYTMLQSIATGTFEDVKFYLFTRRRGGSGFVYAPRPLYANSALICKASAHFDFGASYMQHSDYFMADYKRLGHILIQCCRRGFPRAWRRT